MNEEFYNIIFSCLLVSGISWATWMTKKINSLHDSIRYVNMNLRFIDWDKVPKVSLNDILNNDRSKK